MSRRAGVSRRRQFAVGGLVASAVAVVVLPPVFGLVGLVLGLVAWRRGDPLGAVAAAAAVVATATGLALAALVAR